MKQNVISEATVLEEVKKAIAQTLKLGQYKAGDLLNQVAASAGGRGGGKPDIAQGGTKEIDKLDKAINSLYDIIK